ncbi:MAG: ATP-binding protein, partial [Micrococcales bacterium]|nr:ATP-binding protein [Micrococcales bacterium]
MVPRHLLPFGQRMLNVFPVAVVQGARRVGKSTFAGMLAEGRSHTSLTLDDEAVRRQALDDPRTLASQGGDGLLIVDEVQRAPELLLAIKAQVDRDPRPGRFILTGSSDLMRLSKTPDSLAGRAVTLPLMGFSLGEQLGLDDDFAAAASQRASWQGFTSRWSRTDYAVALCRGSYPEAIGLADADRRVWLRSYLDRLLTGDVRAIGRALPSTRLRSVLRLIAANQSGELVLARLASQLGVTAPTIRECLDVLETMYLVSSLPPWSANLTRRETGRSKVRLDDSALASILVRTSPDKLTSLASAEYFGALLEAFVVTELRKQQTWTKTPFEMYQFRDADGLEVDIVLEFDDGGVFLLEVKASQTYRSEYFS